MIFYGDSIGYDIQDEFARTLRGIGGVTIRTRSFPGIALCDELRFFQGDRRAFEPQIVVFETVGATFTPCTRDPRTGRPPDSPAVYDVIATQAQFAARELGESGILSYWVLAPPVRSGPTPLNERLRQALSTVPSAVIVDATPAVAPDGRFHAQLPCLPEDRCRTAAGEGAVTVRAPDGVHFCPVAHKAFTPCPVWSSGAWRFGSTAARLVAEDLGLAPVAGEGRQPG